MTLPNYSVRIFDQTHTGLKMDDRALSSYMSNRIVRQRCDLISPGTGAGDSPIQLPLVSKKKGERMSTSL